MMSFLPASLWRSALTTSRITAKGMNGNTRLAADVVWQKQHGHQAGANPIELECCRMTIFITRS